MPATDKPSASSSIEPDGAASPVAGPATARPRLAIGYDRVFVISYIANTAIMVAVSLLFRYADFVQRLGGSEWDLGLIVGVGMVGALAMRLFLGVGIDRYGPRAVWIGSLAGFVLSMVLHLFITSAHGPAIYLVRLLMMTSIAGAFGASLTFISLRVPEQRMAEMIGTLGTSGFVGLALGPALGDLLFDAELTRAVVNRMFFGAAASGTVSLVCVIVATWGGIRRPARRATPSLWALVWRYHPGGILVVGAAMGLAIGIPNVFLRAYTAELGINQIKIFFLVYAVVAFVVRMSTVRLCERIGYKPVILAGLLSAAGSMCLYLFVSSAAWLAAPAVLAGMAHAFLFPAIVAGGSIAFPSRYRGLATTLMLAMFDIGNLVGQPAVGRLIETADQFGLPPYPTMFLLVAGLLTVIGLGYFFLAGEPGRKPRR